MCVCVYKTKSIIEQNVRECDHSAFSRRSRSHGIQRKENVGLTAPESIPACLSGHWAAGEHCLPEAESSHTPALYTLKYQQKWSEWPGKGFWGHKTRRQILSEHFEELERGLTCGPVGAELAGEEGSRVSLCAAANRRAVRGPVFAGWMARAKGVRWVCQ